MIFDFITLHSILINAQLEYSTIQTLRSCVEKHSLQRSILKHLFLLIIAILSPLAFNIESKAANNIKVAYGRISLIDFGALISSEPLIKDKSLVNVYPLSGLSNPSNKSIIAIQGLKQNGSTDLIVRTNKSVYQFRILLNNDQGEDIKLNQQNSRTKIIKHSFPLSKERLSVVNLSEHINEYVLAGNPKLISLEQIVNEHDPEYLKTFALNTKSLTGITDIVVASKKSVYKFTVKIGEQNAKHTENISLEQR